MTILREWEKCGEDRHVLYVSRKVNTGTICVLIIIDGEYHEEYSSFVHGKEAKRFERAHKTAAERAIRESRLYFEDDEM